MRALEHGAIAEHAHFGLGIVLIAQVDNVVHNIFEIGVKRRFAVAREGDHVERIASLLHLSQAFAQGALHLVASRHTCSALPLGIKACLAIKAVERTNLAIVRHKVHTQRHTESATVDRTKYGLVK